MSDIPAFPYNLLWEERQLRSVANLSRQDGLDFLKSAPQAGIRTQTTVFPLSEANEVLAKLRAGQLLGAAAPSRRHSMLGQHRSLEFDLICSRVIDFAPATHPEVPAPSSWTR